MKPIVVACQSGSQGRRWPSASRRISCQRIVRTGNVTVATTTVSSSRKPLACRACDQTSRGLMRCNTHASSATLTTSPSNQAQRQRCLLLGFDGEDNEVADFVDDRAQRVAAGALCRFAQLLRALPRPGALVEQGLDVHHFAVRLRGGG